MDTSYLLHCSFNSLNTCYCHNSTNGQDDYPSVWDGFNAEAKAKLFFDSADECCLKYWSLSSCPHTDYCDEGSSGESNVVNNVQDEGSEYCGQWHPGMGEGPKSW